MKIRGLPESYIAAIAKRLDMKISNVREQGRFILFKLDRTPALGERWRPLGHHGRRINAVCFHGFKEFMDEVFKIAPNATIVTTINRYEGREDFERKWRFPIKQGFSSTMNCSHGE
jgi:hypothetical protein